MVSYLKSYQGLGHLGLTVLLMVQSRSSKPDIVFEEIYRKENLKPEVYAQVVYLSSVRLFLAWSLILGWITCCIDFFNAFVQAKLNTSTFIHLPQGFVTKCKQQTCLRLRADEVC